MKLARALIALVFVAISCSPDGTANPDNRPEIIIASDLPIGAYNSGTVSGLAALSAQQAIGLAIRRQGTVEGFRLRYMPLDDALVGRWDEVRGVQNVKRMIRTPEVLGMIGPFNSAVAFAEIKVANRSDLAMISPSNTAYCLTLMAPFCEGARSPNEMRPSRLNNYFRIAAVDPMQGRAMARYVTRNLNLTRVAIFNASGIEGQFITPLIVKEFEHELGLANGQVVLRQDLPSTTQDFRDFMNRAKAAQAQAVYGLGSSKDAPICVAAAQMRGIMPDARFLGTDAIGTDPQCIADAGADNAEGMVVTFSDVDPRWTTDPVVRQQVRAYQNLYPKASDVTLYTFAAYDCARILIDAIGRAIRKNNGNSPTRAQVVTAIAETNDFVGVTGTYSFDKNGDALSPLMSVYQVRGGKWTTGEKIDVSVQRN